MESGCSCSSPAAPAADPAPVGAPCGSRSQRLVIVWDPLALAGSARQVSPAFPLGGANALDFTVVMIGSAGAIQVLYQVQVGNDGANWMDAGSSHQVLAYGNSASLAVTGLSSKYFRILVQNQNANTGVSMVVARLFCNS